MKKDTVYPRPVIRCVEKARIVAKHDVATPKQCCGANLDWYLLPAPAPGSG